MVKIYIDSRMLVSFLFTEDAMSEKKNGLLLRRKLGESIIVGDATIKIVEVGRKAVRLAIIAPKTTKLLF